MAIKGIYIGDKSSKIYIGDKLVWSSTIPEMCEASLLFAPFPIAECTEGGGELHGSHALGAGTVEASPYLRIIAPGLAVNPFAGGIANEAKPEVVPSDIGRGVSVFILSSGARADTHLGETGKAISLYAPVSELKPELSEGEVSTVEHSGMMVFIVPAVSARGEVPTTEHIGGGIHNANLLCADSAEENAKTIFLPFGLMKLSDAEGAIKGVVTFPPHVAEADPAKATGELYKSLTCRSLTPSAELMYLIAGIKEVSTEYMILSAYSAVEMRKGQPSVIGCAEHYGMSAGDAFASYGETASKETSSICMGMCSASMTTEIYTEPTQTDFDTTLIAYMDGLTVSDIDAVAIKN